MTYEPAEEATVSVREEGTSKNPIRHRLRTDRSIADADRLTGMVACGRDFFHSFVSQTVRRRYRRPPIYLVDSWVTQALGLFMLRGGVVAPPADGLRPGADPLPNISGFGPVVRLFEAVEAVEEQLRGARFLSIPEVAGDLQASALRVLTDPASVAQLGRQCRAVEDLVGRALGVLGDDLLLRPHVNRAFGAELAARLHALLLAAEEVAHIRPPPVPGLSFEPGRGAGILFGSIKELDIEGPAILLAPRSIRDWAHKDLARHLRVGDVPHSGRADWFGARSDDELLFSLGIGNVLQHELTHAMLSLPNDPVQELGEKLAQQWSFYREHREFEEGLANFTAAVCSAVLLMKAREGIRGVDLPVLHRGKYAAMLPDYERLMKATYENYYADSTDVFFNAWRANNLDYGAFAGVVKMFATNFGGLNWLETFAGLQHGRILTGR